MIKQYKFHLAGRAMKLTVVKNRSVNSLIIYANESYIKLLYIYIYIKPNYDREELWMRVSLSL